MVVVFSFTSSLALLLISELVGKPVQTLVKAVPAGGTCCLDVPVAVPQGMQTQLVRDLCRIHGIG